MTREEAISNARDVLEEATRTENAVCYVTLDDKEWIEMAIEALSAEPCEDCISRAEAIKALEYNLSVEADGGLDKYRTVIKDLLNAIYNTQKKAIEDLPSIQPKPKTDVLDKIRAEIHATAELHEDGDYYLRDEWIDEIFDDYKAESEDKG